MSWGTGVYDFDNDGLRDIFIAHGGLIHLVPQEHSVFRNLGGGKFADVSGSAGPFFEVKSVAPRSLLRRLRQRRQHRCFHRESAAPGLPVPQHLAQPNHWISDKLTGHKSNRDGIGAQVEVAAGGNKQSHESVAGSGYLSQDDPRVHFGWGGRQGGTRDRHLAQRHPRRRSNVPAGRVLAIEEK